MGKGLFGANGGGLGGLGGLAVRSAATDPAATADNGIAGQLGADPRQSAAAGPRPEPQHPAGDLADRQRRRPRPHRLRCRQNDPPQATQDSQPMNDVLRQLFNR